MNTALTALAKIVHPLLNAPMTPQAGGALAGAVARAGGLGMLGFDESEPIESLREQAALARGDGEGAFGIGLVRWIVDRRPELVELALELRPRLVAISFGDPAPFVARFRAAGILVAAQVQSAALADAALAAGVDIVVAQGTEGGGHTGAVGTLPLLQLVLERAGEVPVVAAGGIATGRGLAAVLAAGAAGAWIGTPFLAASEARSNDAARAKLFASDETQTVLTDVFDRVQDKPWPAEFRGRALRNAFTERFDGAVADLPVAARDEYRDARARRDYRIAHVYAGQTVGFVNRLVPAASIVERIVTDCEARLRGVATLLG